MISTLLLYRGPKTAKSTLSSRFYIKIPYLSNSYKINFLKLKQLNK